MIKFQAYRFQVFCAIQKRSTEVKQQKRRTQELIRKFQILNHNVFSILSATFVTCTFDPFASLVSSVCIVPAL